MSWLDELLYGKPANPKILFIYRNANYGKPGTHMLGLGVNAMHSVSTLRKAGYTVNHAAIWLTEELQNPIEKFNPDIVVLEAPWVELPKFLQIVAANPTVHFTVRCHSNINFLQVEPDAITLLREIQLYSESISNLSVSTNSEALQAYFTQVYGGHVNYLPNLYRYNRPNIKLRPKFIRGNTLRIASWGATRIQKNHTVAAAAALMLAKALDSPLEFYTNSSGGSGAEEIIKAIRNMYANVPWASYKAIGWKTWPLFRREAANMNLCLHMSGTETFNLTTADALAEGVPVVGSIAIDWLRSDWQANHDDEREISEVAKRVLLSNWSSQRALNCIRDVSEKHLSIWNRELRYGFRPFGS